VYAFQLTDPAILGFQHHLALLRFLTEKLRKLDWFYKAYSDFHECNWKDGMRVGESFATLNPTKYVLFLKSKPWSFMG
jgi:hypothetical protein